MVPQSEILICHTPIGPMLLTHIDQKGVGKGDEIRAHTWNLSQSFQKSSIKKYALDYRMVPIMFFVYSLI